MKNKVSRKTLDAIGVIATSRSDSYNYRNPKFESYRTVGNIENCSIELLQDFFFLMTNWEQLAKVAHCLSVGEGGGFAGELSIRLPGDPVEWDEKPIDGIEMIIMDQEAIIDEEGFILLMLRFLDFVLETAERLSDRCTSRS